MRKRPLLAGAMLLGLACLTGDALAKSKKAKDPLEETAPPADKKPAEAVNIQVAATTPAPAATPAAAPATAPAATPARVGVSTSVAAAVAPSDSAVSVAVEPPQPAPAPAAAAAPEPQVETVVVTSGRAFGKAGNFMLNFRLGYVPSWSLGGTSGTGTSTSFDYPPQGLLGAEFGFSIQSQRKMYLIFPLTFEFQGQTAMIMIPIGVQYDIALPIKGLYVTPRISMGYTALVSTINLSAAGGGSSTVVGHAGLIAPEMGIKYILRERLNLGIDLLSVPIVFSPALALVSYRVAAYLGANF